MSRLIFITHPEVMIDPVVRVERWRLNDRGVMRMRQFAEGPVVANVTSVWASTEAKAIEAAGILAARLGVGVEVEHGLGENNRHSTGFLPPAEVEEVADAFFANPQESIRGWERAVDAQRRIRGTVDRILADHRSGDLAIVSHGAVGALLLCSYHRQTISRKADQPFQGHYWTAALPSLKVQHSWKSIAEL